MSIYNISIFDLCGCHVARIVRDLPRLVVYSSTVTRPKDHLEAFDTCHVRDTDIQAESDEVKARGVSVEGSCDLEFVS